MDKPFINNKKGELEKTLPFCYTISGLTNIYTISTYREMTPFGEKCPFYWLGYGLRWLCDTTIPFVMWVCDYISLMSPVFPGKKTLLSQQVSKRRPAVLRKATATPYALCAQCAFCHMAKGVRLGKAKPGDSFGGKVTLVTFSTVAYIFVIARKDFALLTSTRSLS